MSSLFERASIGALALAGIVGSVLAGRELRRATLACRGLYGNDLIGSQIESDLEYQAEESRRAFLYALAVRDPNDQLPYVDEARAAGARVRRQSAACVHWSRRKSARRSGSSTAPGKSTAPRATKSLR